MFRSVLFKFVLYLNAVGISLAFGQNDRTPKEVFDLVKAYRHIIEFRLNGDHVYYGQSHFFHHVDNGPPHRSFAGSSSSGGGVRAHGQKLIDMVIWYFNRGHYTIAYESVISVLESMCYTYMYRFCVYAIAMNERGLNLTQSQMRFSKLLNIMRRTFEEDGLERLYIDYLENIYAHSGENYSSQLTEFMESIQNKIYFPQLELYDQQSDLQMLPLEQLEKAQKDEIRDAISIFQKSRVEADTEADTEDGLVTQYEDRCIICWENFDPDEGIVGFWPCGHVNFCPKCVNIDQNLIQVCPLCRQNQVYVKVFIVKPSTLLEYDIWDRIPRNEIDKVARCINCKEDKKLEKNIIAIPCGHGLFCQNCIDLKNCPVCGVGIARIIFLYF